jgi:tripeptidyl-peptidase-1
VKGGIDDINDIDDKEFNINYKMIMKLSNIEYMKNLLSNISDPTNELFTNEDKFLSKEKIDIISKPNYESINIVTNFINSNGLNCSEYSGYFLCNDHYKIVEKIYQVNIKFVSVNDKFYYSSINDYTLPKNLDGHVLFIIGFSQIFERYDTIRNQNNQIKFVARETQDRIYNISSKLKSHVNVGLIEFDGLGFLQNELIQSQISNDIYPKMIDPDKIIGFSDGQGIESSLDVQTVSQISPNVNMWYINYPKRSWIIDMAQDLYEKPIIPDILSISYAWSERNQCYFINCTHESSKQYIERTEHDMLRLSLRGITMIVASGDAGAPGRTNEGCDPFEYHLNPSYPSSSSYVTSVGGTFLIDNPKSNIESQSPLCKKYGCNKGSLSQSVNYLFNSWTSGGGFALYQNYSSYQKYFIEQYLNSDTYLPPLNQSIGHVSYWNHNGRGYPDVTMNGHGCPVFFDYGITDIDGTSCSTPTFAGMISLLLESIRNTKKNFKFGFLNPLLYQSKLHSNSFTQPIGGNNSCTESGCCQKHFGYQSPQPINKTLWNPVTGIGYPNYGNLESYILSLFE